ncbi:MAG: UDP-glucose/GDP-mannose dehydrogenase family protein [Candidatus Korobacteraceae bacterium]
MRITVLGCGYVGLVTGACLADIGHSVICTDNDESKIEVLQGGSLPIYEPHLQELVDRNVAAERLRFTADLAEAIRFGDVIFICVGTPPLQNGDADLSSIDGSARLIASAARSSKLIVEKSTVPVQSGMKLLRALGIYGRNSQWSFSIASNPEFLREGSAVLDFMHPDRVVVGVDDHSSELLLREIYRPILQQELRNCPIHAGACPRKEPPALLVTSINSAELIKHASNSFLALKISYANLVADICEAMGADVEEVTRGMGLDSRIGHDFLSAGLGFGGFCFPKDIQAFTRLCEKTGVDASLLKEAELINKRRIDVFLAKATQALWTLKDKRIGILGLAFKPNTDDIRFAPALELINRLLQEHARISVYDPQAMDNTRELYADIRYCADAYELADGSEALMIATEWPEFMSLDWPRISRIMQRPLLLDGRNLLDCKEMERLGFEYYGVGVPSAAAGEPKPVPLSPGSVSWYSVPRPA